MLVSRGTTLFVLEHLDEIAHVKHEKDENKWHGKFIKYYRKGTRKVDEQHSLEGKRYLKEKENSKMRWRNGKKMEPVHFKDTWDISLVLNSVKRSTTLEFSEPVLTSQPISASLLRVSQSGRDSFLWTHLSANQLTTASPMMSSTYALKWSSPRTPPEMNKLLCWVRP